MTDMWREAEAYAEYHGEGRYDDPPAPDAAPVDPRTAALHALEEAAAAIRDERQRVLRDAWPGLHIAESVIETLIAECRRRAA